MKGFGEDHESNLKSNKSKLNSQERIVNHAIQLHVRGDILEATKYYQNCIEQGIKDCRVFSNYGIILNNLGKLKDAELLYRKAIEINPNYANANCNLGNLLCDLRRLKDAEFYTRKAIELNPNFAICHANLGDLLRDLGKLKDSEFHTRKAIEINPNYAIAHSNLGSFLRDYGNLKDAEVSTRKAIALKPDYAIAHANLGNILSDLGKLKEAEISQRKAISLDPDFADAYFSLSLIELAEGNYQNGLENYEYRFKTKKPTIPHGQTKLERIDHKKFKSGEKLLVISEQGLGDTLQYMRFVPYLKKQGHDVIFAAQEKLHSLIKSSGIDQNPLTPGQTSSVLDGQWIPLLSLPRYLRVRPDNPIISKPYIYSTDKLNKKWKNILSKEKRPIIGINWQGNKGTEINFHKGRSLPLEIFSTLARNNNLRFLSLQKGFGAEQLDYCSFKDKFVSCQDQIDSTWDFLENASIIENCNLIITSDTSIAHLAGGMGKKVWLLLKDIPYWTWGLEGDSTFWYPSMRLFRQNKRNNWQNVMETVSSTIKKELDGNYEFKN